MYNTFRMNLRIYFLRIYIDFHALKIDLIRSDHRARIYERSKGKGKNDMRDYINSDTIIVTTYQYYSMHRINQ